MKKRMKVTDLDQIASFKRSVSAPDEYGNKVDGFEEVFREWAKVKPMKGGEGVFESRLASRQPAILTVRAISAVEVVDSDWQVVAGGSVWDIKEPPRLTEDRQYFEMLVERGSSIG